MSHNSPFAPIVPVLALTAKFPSAHMSDLKLRAFSSLNFTLSMAAWSFSNDLANSQQEALQNLLGLPLPVWTGNASPQVRQPFAPCAVPLVFPLLMGLFICN
jgi:hypothetical protein